MFMVDITIVPIVFMGVINQHSHHWGTILYGLWPSHQGSLMAETTCNKHPTISTPFSRASVDMALCVQSVLKQNIQKMEMHISGQMK